jgi:hypothetical protein
MSPKEDTREIISQVLVKCVEITHYLTSESNTRGIHHVQMGDLCPFRGERSCPIIYLMLQFERFSRVGGVDLPPRRYDIRMLPSVLFFIFF